MAETDGDDPGAKFEQALLQEQQQERTEQDEELRRQGDIDLRIADALARRGTSERAVSEV